MKWLDDIKTQFINGFSRDIVCHFADGDIYRNMSTGASVSEQPVNTEWMRFSVSTGSVSNLTIGTATSKLKSQVFNVNISVFVPRNSTFNAAAAIESDADAAMIFESIVTADPGCISMDESEPKIQDIIYADSGEVWNQINLTYRYFYRYI